MLFPNLKVKFHQPFTAAQSLLVVILCCFSWLMAPAALALESDRNQPIQIVADSAELNEGKGFYIYTGNVIISQGSLVIEAASVKVILDDNGLQSMLATKGKHQGRAYMRQQGEANDGLMEAWAESIDYQVERELLMLLGNAELIQKGNHFSGHTIRFDMPADNIKASGGDTGRVRMIFLPKPN
jgi:lipopolysaccharide export system protein LptA